MTGVQTCALPICWWAVLFKWCQHFHPTRFVLIDWDLDMGPVVDPLVKIFSMRQTQTCKINAVLLFMNNSSSTFKFSIKQTLVFFFKKKNPIVICRYFRRFLSDECVCSPLSGFINFFPSVKPFDYTLRFSFYLFSFPVPFSKSYPWRFAFSKNKKLSYLSVIGLGYRF